MKTHDEPLTGSSPLRSGGTPPRALAISVGSLAVAAQGSMVWPDSLEYSALVWVLTLVPVFLLSYHRGWKGAAFAAAGGMAVLAGVDVVFVRLLGQELDGRLLAGAVILLAPVTLGAGVVSEMLRRRQGLLLEMAYRDPLTGLANRRLLREQADSAIARATRSLGKVGMVFLDIVQFKRVNDSLGHAAGDEALTRLAERLLESQRAGDVVARVGGDEFAVLLPDVEALKDAVQAARRIQKEFQVPLRVQGQTLYLRPRIGVAVYPDHAENFDTLLTNADPARHRHGPRSEENVVVYRPPAVESRDELALEAELWQAVERNELTIHYQPIYRLRDGGLEGAEALVRWDHRRWGLLQAGEFITIAEDTGLMQRLERRVLAMVVEQLAEWGSDGPTWVTVNLSPASLEDTGLLDELKDRLRRRAVDPGRLVVEVTERSVARSVARVGEVFEELAALGIRVAIDDFGTGYSSLGHLEYLSAHFLKIDGTFVRRLGRDRKQERMIEGIIGLARGLDMSLVAEGVEEECQLGWLETSGCEYVQGFFTGRPMPAHELLAMAVPGGRAPSGRGWPPGSVQAAERLSPPGSVPVRGRRPERGFPPLHTGTDPLP